MAHAKSMKDPVRLPQALGVCSRCIQDLNRANGLMVTVYCSHNGAGAIMYLKAGVPEGRWEVYTPISRNDFDALVEDRMNVARVLIEELGALAREKSCGVQ